jgi:nitroreductase
MSNPILETIQKRRSHRKYLPKQLSQEQLDAILEAALQAPSALNNQPWHYTVVQDAALLARINAAAHKQAALIDPDQRSPRFADPAFHVLYHSPTAIFISGADTHYAPVDCGIAVQTIALAAESLGLGSVIVALTRLAFEGTDKAEFEQALGFPVGYRFVISIAIGYPDDDKAAHPINPDKITLIRA